jgi:hypothetical protein
MRKILWEGVKMQNTEVRISNRDHFSTPAVAYAHASLHADAHVLSLQKELEEMKKKLQKEKEKAAKGGGVPVTADGTIQIARFEAIQNFVLDPFDASYVVRTSATVCVAGTMLTMILHCS